MTRHVTIACFIVLATAFTFDVAIGRTWTDQKGRKVKAEFIAFQDGKVKLKRESDGKIFQLLLEQLSENDQAFVESHTKVPFVTDTLIARDDDKGSPEWPFRFPLPKDFTLSEHVRWQDRDVWILRGNKRLPDEDGSKEVTDTILIIRGKDVPGKNDGSWSVRAAYLAAEVAAGYKLASTKPKDVSGYTIVSSSNKAIDGFFVLGEPNMNVMSKKSGGVKFDKSGKEVFGLGGIAVKSDSQIIMVAGATIALKKQMWLIQDAAGAVCTNFRKELSPPK